MTTGQVGKHIARSWRHHFGLQLATVFVLSLVLIVLSFVLGLRQNVTRVNASWGDSLELTVYMKDGVPQDTVAAFVNNLQNGSEFSQVHLVSKEESLKRFAARMGQLAPDFVRAPDAENPLPSYIEIKLKGEESRTR